MAAEDEHEIPEALLELLRREHPRGLLLLLGQKRKQGVRYAEARRTLALTSSEFQRAINALEDYALIEMKVQKLKGPGLGAANRAVTLFLSPMGESMYEWWQLASEGLRTTFSRHHLLAELHSAFYGDADEEDFQEA